MSRFGQRTRLAAVFLSLDTNKQVKQWFGSPFAFRSIVTGGTISSDSTYFYRTFTGNGTISVTGAGLTADILIIAGGGSGSIGKTGTYFGSGAGSGEVKSLANQNLLGDYNITIGGGGAALANSQLNLDGNPGISSSFESLIASTTPGGAGLFNTGVGGSSGNGFTGGSPNGTRTGGGAGSGANGQNADGSKSGDGGTGVNTITGIGSFSAWLTATGAGSSGNISGGGGGSNSSTAGNGAGGSGGGGVGALGNAAAGNGVANTGSGGGGGVFQTQNSGSGGSGIVIVRYTKVQVE